MARLVWNQPNENRYEFGVDHGVFYDVDNFGTVWNGIVSVNESSDGGETNSYHYDGVKYLTNKDPSSYTAELVAFSAPPKVAKAIGDDSLVPGFILTRQSRTRFGLSYRTFMGPGDGYKIHIVYNILARQKSRSYSTIDDSSAIETFSWDLVAVPTPTVPKDYRPSAHYILDSLKMIPDALTALEGILYGTDRTPARLPTFDELINIGVLWKPLVIIPQSVTGLANLVSQIGDLYTTEQPGLNRALAQGRLIQSPVNGLYRLE